MLASPADEAAYLKPLNLHTQHAAKFDAAGYEMEEDLREYVVGEGKSVDDLAAEFELPKPHARKLHEFLVGVGGGRRRRRSRNDRKVRALLHSALA